MRGKQAPKRKIDPDPKYGSLLIAKFINLLMSRGKKSTARAVFYGAFDAIKAKGQDPQSVFDQAMKNVGPAMEIRPRRVGGANYQIPFPVSPDRRNLLAMRWLITAARARKGKPMAKRLLEEFEDAAKGEGAAMKKKLDVQKMAEANRAFAHFARYG
ncbi:30S ribosomal protein S7 [Candidatus Uhrbacteria bacterium RIFCSPLOWO2_01_FULL_55_36]|uniref:Small ribosomal subunit protein uS7 n=1 Tax=Candidatus Uhrbacteria bacterium RIFCSPLOWO2_01_FULL_55_36 TaxID=1802404 RepID=A0A1F7UZG0_9BACT|nr:MAG: 30S ribosomal protein S7 [Candidatus Uhrbacteria bacterium RIFCSPLOWO2_01_FULL_55_36]